ncbi:hypothetical protein DERP_008942 [Dermatophagoides pteronyssinus]|uniref:Uncharacterized protein n=1 Tax=Dermatophagoides pteronyssinus TaxID=6956 RepID=A0ABQ8JNG2_DERPT|nr:hypothetical protein DERP_008942 [Dermatophagoides pteronyssinus]
MSGKCYNNQKKEEKNSYHRLNTRKYIPGLYNSDTYHHHDDDEPFVPIVETITNKLQSRISYL